MSTKARNKKRKEKARIAYVASLPAFEVIKPFKYNGKMFEVGQEWKPEGGTWDKLLMEQKEYVLPVENTKEIRAKKVEQATARLAQMPGYQS